MRTELNTIEDMRAVDFKFGTICAVCNHPINGLPALWLAVKSLDFFVHKDCEPGFTPEVVNRTIGDFVLLKQDESLHDSPPENN